LDTLTGLLDRRSFIARARERLQAPGTHTLVVADLDRLRRLNEALGHERADLVLAALGSRLSAAFPPGALMARVGEDEFAVLSCAAVERPDEIIRDALEQPLRVAGFDIFPTLSIGAVSIEGGADAPVVSELLRRAELAVESAKGGGRGGAAASRGWRWNRICAAPYRAARLYPSISPWCVSRTAPSPALRRWPAGVTRAAA